MSETATRTYEGATIPTPGTFDLDPNHTSVEFVARHMMVSKVRGKFHQATGSITIAEDPLRSQVTVSIATASIDTGQADRDGHLRSADFLDVEKFPAITFASKRVEKFDGTEFVLIGDLTVRDTTAEVELKAELEGIAKSPWGQEVIGFTASTEIDREEFGMTWNQALETGGFLVGKKVKIELSVEGIRQA